MEWLNSLFTILIVACALRVIWVDIRRLEIEYESLTILAILAILQEITFSEHIWPKLFIALSFFSIVFFVKKKKIIPIGKGDLYLIPVAMFLAASSFWPHPQFAFIWLIIMALLMFLTAAFYSIRRGKKFLKSPFPLALPIMLSGLIIYIWI